MLDNDYLVIAVKLNKICVTSRHKLEQFPFSRYLVAKRCNCH